MQDGTPEAKHLRNLMLINYANLDHSLGKVSEFLMQLKISNFDSKGSAGVVSLVIMVTGWLPQKKLIIW